MPWLEVMAMLMALTALSSSNPIEGALFIVVQLSFVLICILRKCLTRFSISISLCFETYPFE